MLRYVILHHTGIAEPHYDVMHEQESDRDAGLTTLRAPQWPPQINDIWQELADHRLAYLDYEGAVSGGRGVVRRIEAGHLLLTDVTNDPPTFAMRLQSHDRQLDITLSHVYLPNDDRATLWQVISVAISSDGA